MVDQDRDLISLDEAVHLFQVSKVTLHAWFRAGTLKRYKRAGDRRTFLDRRVLVRLREFREEP